MRTIKSKISGVTFENRQNLIKKYARVGKSIYVQSEPDNKHDKNAKAIYIESGFWIFKKFHKLGYINANIAEEDICIREEAKIIDVTGGGFFRKKLYGVNIELTILEPDEEGYSY